MQKPKKASSNDLYNLVSSINNSVSQIKKPPPINNKRYSINERTHDKTNEKIRKGSLDVRNSHLLDMKTINILNDFFKNLQEIYIRNNDGEVPKEINLLIELYKSRMLPSVILQQSQTISHNFETTKTLPFEVTEERIFVGKTSAGLIKLNNANESESMENILEQHNTTLDKKFISETTATEKKSGEHSHPRMTASKDKYKNFKLNLNINTNDSSRNRISEQSNLKREDSERKESDSISKNPSEKSMPLKTLEEKANKLFSKYINIKNEIHHEFSKHNLLNFKNKFKLSKLHPTNSPVRTTKNEKNHDHIHFLEDFFK